MLTGLFVLLLGLGGLVAGANAVRVARRMRAYRSVPGTVLLREVVRVVTSAANRASAFGDGGSYQARVRYRYVVDGIERESDRMTFVPQGCKESLAQERLAKIPDVVEVWYDPQKPSDALLERPGTGLGWLFIVIGVLLTLGALLKILASV